MKAKRWTVLSRAVLVLLLISVLMPLSIMAGAETSDMTVAQFDKSTAEDDLKGTTVGGENFSLLKYPYNSSGDVSVITLLEFGYGTGDSALYLYVYNPRDISISKSDMRHAITLSFGNGGYHKYTMSLLSSFGDSEHNQLYLKFKVRLSSSLDKLIPNAAERTYSIGEIEFSAANDNTKSYAVGSKWIYSGLSSDNTLTSKSEITSVIEIETHSLVGRGDDYVNIFCPDSEVDDLFSYDQVDSVYFALPKNFEELYGEIQSIRCTWTEYDSGWILACKTDDVYNMLSGVAGAPVKGYDKSYPKITEPSLDGNTLYFGWNVSDNTTTYLRTDTLQWVTKYSGDKSNTMMLVDSDLQSQMNAAWIASQNGESNYFSKGGIKKDVDILSNSAFSVITNKDVPWYKNIFCKDTTDQLTVQALQKVSEGQLADLKNNYLVDQSYYDELSKSLTEAETAGSDLMILHFAESVYYGIPVKGQGYLFDSDTWINDSKENMYACKEQVYMGFDIIQFTCLKDGETVVVPVGASPINVIGKLKIGGKDGLPSWLIILLIVIAVILLPVLLPILAPILKPLLQALVWLIALPFKLLWWLLKAVGKGVSALFRKIAEAISSHKK